MAASAAASRCVDDMLGVSVGCSYRPAKQASTPHATASRDIDEAFRAGLDGMLGAGVGYSYRPTSLGVAAREAALRGIGNVLRAGVDVILNAGNGCSYRPPNLSRLCMRWRCGAST